MRITTVALLCVAAAALLTAQERELHFEVTVPVSVEDAFRMWTDPAVARQFLALEVRIEPWAGGRYETLFDPENDPAGARAGTYGSTVLDITPPERLVFEWESLTPQAAAAELGGERKLQLSYVEVRFEAGSLSTTAVHIRHYGFGDDAHWDAAYRYYRDHGWPWILARLDRLFAAPDEAR